MADDREPPGIPDQWIEDLARSGALCKCGGVHVSGVDALILLNASPSGRKIPVCTCLPCPSCGEWKELATEEVRVLLGQPSPGR